MRIGIDATCWFHRRGFGRFLRELIQALAALDTSDEYVLLADRQTAYAPGFPSYWPVLVGDTSTAPRQAASAQGRRSLRDLWVMQRLAQQATVDLLFFPAVYSYFPVLGTVPCLVTFHDVIAETLPHLVFTTWQSRLLWNLKSRLAVHRASCLLTVSEASKQDLQHTFGVAAERIYVVPEAAASTFQAIDRQHATHRSVLGRYNIWPTERFLLYVGGISPHKNLETLVRGFTQLRRDPAYRDVRLILVGDYMTDTFHTCYDALVQLVERFGIRDSVRFLGFVPDADLVHLYAAAQAMVFPSYLEGFGLPAIEAMACGAAVLASAKGALPEVLQGAGHLFDPHDVSTLVQGLQHILTDRQYQATLQARSLARAHEFSWEQSARCAVAIFHDTVRQTATP